MKLGTRIGSKRPPLAPDAAVIRALAGLLAETVLTEIEYAVGDHRIRVAREPDSAAAPAKNGHAKPPDTPAPEPAIPANGAPPAGTLTSPMVGIVYLAPEPGAAPFVRPSDTVSEGQPLLVIEAMKVMNQIRAPHGGRVTRIFAQDAEPVEYGAPLLVIE